MVNTWSGTGYFFKIINIILNSTSFGFGTKQEKGLLFAKLKINWMYAFINIYLYENHFQKTASNTMDVFTWTCPILSRHDIQLYSKSPFKLSLWAKRSSNIVRIVLPESNKFEKLLENGLKTTIAILGFTYSLYRILNMLKPIVSHG